MNYFLSNLFRDKLIWIGAGLCALAGLIIMDLLTFMLMPQPVFNLWTVKVTVAAAVLGAVIYGIFLARREKKDRRLGVLLPGFLEERRAFLAARAGADPGFQTLCHQCRHFDLGRLRCLLTLRDRKAWIRLHDESRIRHCLYWNLEDGHPVLVLTERLTRGKEDAGAAGEPRREEGEPQDGRCTGAN
jgi:hypothetical protein